MRKISMKEYGSMKSSNHKHWTNKEEAIFYYERSVDKSNGYDSRTDPRNPRNWDW